MHYKHETVETLGQKLRDGTTTAQQQADRARQAAARAEPVFITTVEDDAAANSSDQRFQSHAPRSALEGIPIAVKDVIATAGVRTTMGSRLFSDHVPSEDAQIVKQLKAAGANIVGKSNTHEFSFGIRGDSTAFGVVPNPHDETRIAGGSSSGSAAAVARGIVPLAVGTDTAGSIRVPAALCGAVGFKPTYDLLDTTGIFPLAPSFDTAGFLGTTVQDIIVAMAAVGVESISDLSETGVDL
ncbi:MAG: amidase, partial [Yaniella sp.]|nr:amidase [Yaniella sp.]